MSSYLAFLGNNPALSVAELSCLLPDFLPKPAVGQLVEFETAEELDQAFLNKLGGTILIAKKVETPVSALSEIPSVLIKELEKAKGKATFGLRFFGIKPNDAKGLFKTCKETLKNRGIASRYIGSEREAAKPIQLHDEGVLNPKTGCELTINKTADGLWAGRTIAAQDVKAYTQRDIGKPVRDTTVGLLPPKLAQMMLNFGEYIVKRMHGKLPKEVTMLDPFCGTGVVPIESLLRGWNVLASDISQKAVSGTSRNLEWTRKTYKIAKKDADSKVWKQDAIRPFALKELPTMIVTEGTLGPNLRNKPGVKDAEKMARDIDSIAVGFLKNVGATLKKTPIVITFPVWFAQKRNVWLTKIWNAVREAGYKPVLPPHTTPTSPDRFSLLYKRADQVVAREIVLLMPK